MSNAHFTDVHVHFCALIKDPPKSLAATVRIIFCMCFTMRMWISKTWRKNSIDAAVWITA